MDGSESKLAMLGLGDVVLPGIMIGLALRYDLYRHYLRKGEACRTGPHIDAAPDAKRLKDATAYEKPVYVPMTGKWGERLWSKTVRWNPDVTFEKLFDLDRGAFQKTYFTAAIVGYIVGMTATLVVMQVAQHAQPALLYLVPGVLGALWLTALVRGELSQMWAFTEDEESEKKPAEKEATKKAGDKEKDLASEPAKAELKTKPPTGEIFSIRVRAPPALLRRRDVLDTPNSVEKALD